MSANKNLKVFLLAYLKFGVEHGRFIKTNYIAGSMAAYSEQQVREGLAELYSEGKLERKRLFGRWYGYRLKVGVAEKT